MNTRLGKLIKKRFKDSLIFIRVEENYLKEKMFWFEIILYNDYCKLLVSDKKVCRVINGTISLISIENINKVLSEL